MHHESEQLGVVLQHASWVERQAAQIAKGHELGHGPGPHTNVESPEFQLRLGRVYKMTLPPGYLKVVSDSFGRCSEMMSAVRPSGPVADAWETLARYLLASAKATAVNPGRAPRPSACEFSDNTMELVRHEELAKLMHPDLVEQLRDAAGTVIRHCRFISPIAPDEIQLACLQHLALGLKQADIAECLGYSVRNVQRILAGMWEQYGVENATQGVAFAVAQGWITIPEPGS